MLTSIPVSDFVNPKRGSRPHNAIMRALDLQPDVQLIGEWVTKSGRVERYFRVKAKGHDRHCVIEWIDRVSEQPVAKCDCEAHYVPHEPTHCFHIAAVLIHEAENGTTPAKYETAWP